MDDVFVCGEENFKSGALGLVEEISVKKRAPSLFVSGFDSVFWQKVANIHRRALIEEDQHLTYWRRFESLSGEVENSLDLVSGKSVEHTSDLIYG